MINIYDDSGEQIPLSSLMPRDRICYGDGSRDCCSICGDYGYTWDNEAHEFVSCKFSKPYIGPGHSEFGFKNVLLIPEKKLRILDRIKYRLSTLLGGQAG